MLISSLAQEHKNELDRLNANFAEKCEEFNELEQNLKDTIIQLNKGEELNII